MGEQREGPYVKRLCIGCRHYDQEPFSIQGDTGYDKFCIHPDVERKSLSSPYFEAQTPDWCPVDPAPSVKYRHEEKP